MQGLFIITPLSTLKQIIYRSQSILVSEEGSLVPQAIPVSGRGNEHEYKARKKVEYELHFKAIKFQSNKQVYNNPMKIL